MVAASGDHELEEVKRLRCGGRGMGSAQLLEMAEILAVGMLR